MRIITGKYKGRRFDIPKTFKARPTTDFAKENIFNVMTGYLDFEGINALDLFAGTGSITLELLSRGCDRVVSVEKDPAHQRFTKQCLEKIAGEKGSYGEDIKRVILIKGDVMRFIRSTTHKFDLIFADPPYQLENIAELPEMILGSGILTKGGLLVFEHGSKNTFKENPLFVEQKVYGSVNFSLFVNK